MEKKKISDYTIYCTEEQVKKALELGAPIESYPIMFVPHDVPRYEKQINKGWIAFPSPTAEQMICWLEEQGIHEVRVAQNSCLKWYFCVCGKIKNKFSTRKEATIASIDAALEYLNNRKNK